MTDVSRRSFFKLLTGAIAASAAGLELLPAEKTVLARHLRDFSIVESRWIHRIDVRIGMDIHGVDFYSAGKIPTLDEMEPPLLVLSNHIEKITGNDVVIKLGEPTSVEDAAQI